MKLSLFDKMIVPILLYGSEVWGIYGYKEIDKLHLKYCKRILSVKQQTPSCAVYGELGRFPLSNICIEIIEILVIYFKEPKLLYV